MSKTAFITGATGFLGQHLVDVLVRDGHIVIAFVRGSSKTAALEALGVQCVVGNMHDAASIAAAMPMDVDLVIHAAANLTAWQPKHSDQWEDNVVATQAMCDAALKRHAKRFVFVSSITSYGVASTVWTEDMAQEGHRSGLHYAATKLAAEEHVRDATRQGLHAVIVNPCHILGPYDTQMWSRLFILISKNALDGIPPGGGSFAYGPHVARAILAAAEKGRVGHNYILGGPNASFQDLLVTAAAALGKEETRAPLPRPLFLFLGWAYDWYSYLITGSEPPLTYEGAVLTTASMFADSSKAKTELGYTTMPLDEMVRDTISWLKTQDLV
ncbi:Aste57867_4489 [Aphanomyces stellatus]|uniref:Aste57867_4489 protein n=1 Tax=Aphanomyces stellatus TaxID=120398 RepID=A0A485KD59_9STRA|nr:hypothetical protein As57867_004476 [Aphanomyces stellatus]VFT81599.1 Aste57867_4489 [Aphanomyces stellatus]